MSERQVFTVTQLSQYLKNLFWKDNHLQNLWVSGEISNYKCHSPSGHIYFTLKDEQSVLRSVFFRSKNISLKFVPAEGMKVIARGSISLYERSGYYQLYVEELEPEGLGALFLAYEQLKDKLVKQGLFDERYKKPLPRIPQKIGLITSPSGAAVRDFLTTLQRRFPCVQVLLYPVAVQGREAPQQICCALKELDCLGDLDVIVITRGGGSLEELWCFNDEEVARAIFAMCTPVVSAIGHETDYTIADFVADRRASTPTAAAELIAPEKGELLRYLHMQEQLMGSILLNSLQKKRSRMEFFVSAAALRHPREKINLGNQRVDELWPRLKRATAYTVQLKKRSLESHTERLDALSPLKVLERGYTLVFDREDRPLKSVGSLLEGQEIRVSFYDGDAYCNVHKVSRKEEDIPCRQKN
ncbi:MAG: exodeoxyribonuclease VII large subunit [Bacillota bacterium]